MSTRDIIIIMIIVGVLTVVGNFIGYNNGIIESIPGMLILIATAVAGVILAKIIPIKIPSVAYVVLIGTIITLPAFPGSTAISNYVAKINFLALTTPILAYAGISIGKDIDSFIKSGWRIIILSCFVFVGTYISSAIIAQLILSALGQI